MHLQNKKVEIDFISEEEIIAERKCFINLLEDNLKINFPNNGSLTKYAIKSYEEMLRFKQDDSAILIGAFNTEKVVGFLWAYKRMVLDEVSIHIGHIVVDSEVRSAGIGSKLLEYLENYSIQEDIKKIDLMTTIENEKTMRFYNANGFSVVRVQLEKELGDSDDN